MAVSTIDALYNGGSEKVTATSTGISVTGTVTADAYALDSIALPSAGTATIFNRNTDNNLYIQTGSGNTVNVLDGGQNTMYAVSPTSHIFQISNAEKMRIDASGNVGIGTVPSGNLTSGYNLRLDGGAQTYLSFNNDTHTTQVTGGFVIGNDSGAARITQRQNQPMIFGTNNAERMRIGSGGDLLVGTPSLIGGGGVGIGLQTDAGGAYLSRRTSTTNNNSVALFYNPNGLVGSIQTSGSATSFNTSSDYRLKTDAQPMTGASARVQALNPVNFEWIVDGTRTDGFLAHEAQAVVPECATGTKDAMQDEEYEVTAAVYEDVVIEAVLDDEGNELEAERTEQNLVTEAVMGTRNVPDYQGIDQSKIVPLLTAALQEALTEIAALKARVTTLEG